MTSESETSIRLEENSGAAIPSSDYVHVAVRGHEAAVADAVNNHNNNNSMPCRGAKPLGPGVPDSDRINCATIRRDHSQREQLHCSNNDEEMGVDLTALMYRHGNGHW